MRALAGVLRRFAEEGSVRLRVAGQCMAPAVQDGAFVEVRASRFYWPGDVVACLDGAGRIVIHRVIGYRPGSGGFRMITQADASKVPDTPVLLANVIGRTGAVPASMRLRAIRRFLRLASRRLLKRIL